MLSLSIMVRRQMTRQEERDNSPYFEEILAAATRLFAQQGYMGTSMRDLGQEIGLHAGSLYVHIKTKEDVLFAIVDRISRKSEADMAAVMESDEPPLDKVRQVAVNIMQLIHDNRDAATVYFHEWKNLSARHRTKVIASRDRWEESLRGILSDCISDGTIKRVDVKFAGMALEGMLNWTYQWYSPDGPVSPTILASYFFDFFIEGLRKR